LDLDSFEVIANNPIVVFVGERLQLNRKVEIFTLTQQLLSELYVKLNSMKTREGSIANPSKYLHHLKKMEICLDSKEGSEVMKYHSFYKQLNKKEVLEKISSTIQLENEYFPHPLILFRIPLEA